MDALFSPFHEIGTMRQRLQHMIRHKVPTIDPLCPQRSAWISHPPSRPTPTHIPLRSTYYPLLAQLFQVHSIASIHLFHFFTCLYRFSFVMTNYHVVGGVLLTNAAVPPILYWKTDILQVHYDLVLPM